MKKQLIYFLLALTAVCLGACNNDDEIDTAHSILSISGQFVRVSGGEERFRRLVARQLHISLQHRFHVSHEGHRKRP